MARYYFDLLNGGGLVRDEVGQEIPTPDGIRQEVGRVLADIAREELPGQRAGTISIEVRDEHDQPIFSGCLRFTTHWYDEEKAGSSNAGPDGANG